MKSPQKLIDPLVLKNFNAVPATDEQRQASGAYIYSKNIDSYSVTTAELRALENAFYNAPEGSIEEEDYAQRLAKHYMILSAQDAQCGDDFRSDSKTEDFTRHAAELYGMPIEKIVHMLEKMEHDGGLLELLNRPIIKDIKKWQQYYYGEVLERASAGYEEGQLLYAEDIRTVLANFMQAQRDMGFCPYEGWEVELRKDSATVAVSAGKKRVYIGENRNPMELNDVRALALHEIGVHAERSDTARTLADTEESREILSTGKLPGYLDAEEGFAILREAVYTGVIPQKAIDRYVDAGYALGMVDGVKHTYSETIERVMQREAKRREIGVEDLPSTVTSQLELHVQRLYRGTKGGDTVGVFTKDIAYFAGFVKMLEYIEQEVEGLVEAGEDREFAVDAVMARMMLAKYDPTNPAHVAYVSEHIQ